jgi:hypothetical protein
VLRKHYEGIIDKVTLVGIDAVRVALAALSVDLTFDRGTARLQPCRQRQ